jgi:hypothetical protein
VKNDLLDDACPGAPLIQIDAPQPGQAVAVDGPLNRSQQARLALDLVECERILASRQGLGVAARRVAHVEVVQRAVVPFAPATSCSTRVFLPSAVHR